MELVPFPLPGLPFKDLICLGSWSIACVGEYGKRGVYNARSKTFASPLGVGGLPGERRAAGLIPFSLCFSPAGQQQLTVQNVSGNNLTISGLSPTQIQLQMEQALSGEIQPGEKRRRMACTCPNCKDGEKR